MQGRKIKPSRHSLLSGIVAVVGLPSAVDDVMFLLSLLQLASLYVAGFIVFASIPAFDCVHTACVGAPVVSYISAVACIPAVVSGHDIAVSLKGHGNEADFLGFLQKLGLHRSLTLPFEPFRFWLRIRGDIRNQKTTPRLAESGSR